MALSTGALDADGVVIHDNAGMLKRMQDVQPEGHFLKSARGNGAHGKTASGSVSVNPGMYSPVRDCS